MPPTPGRGERHERPRLRQPRLAEIVAARVRDDIVAGRLVDGERLPRQEQFARDLGVGIAVVREALRILESEGLVVVHRGKVGGATVRRPTAAALIPLLVTVLTSAGVAPADAAATLALLDGACAARCALLGERDGVVSAATPAVGDSDRFHSELAERCGLETLRILVVALNGVAAGGARRSCDAQPAAGVRAHQRVLAAIAERDVADAFLAGSHLAGSR